MLRHLLEVPQSSLISSNIHPQKPTPPGSPKAEQKENMSCRQHRKNPGFLFELGQVLEAVSNAGAACGGGFSQCLGTRGPSGVRVYRRNAVSTQAGHRPRQHQSQLSCGLFKVAHCGQSSSIMTKLQSREHLKSQSPLASIHTKQPLLGPWKLGLSCFAQLEVWGPLWTKNVICMNKLPEAPGPGAPVLSHL